MHICRLLQNNKQKITCTAEQLSNFNHLKTKMNKNKEITSNLTYKLLKLDKLFILFLNLGNRVVRQIVFGEPLNCTS